MPITILIAACIDLILGDPIYPYHPIRIIGNSISFWDKKLSSIPMNGYIRGALLWIIIISFSYALFLFFPTIVLSYNKELGELLILFLCYSFIAFKDLMGHAQNVVQALEEQDIVKAREKLSWIVGRDTKNLSESDVSRATLETVAENLSDGVIAPLFYGLLFGLPGMVFYKTINTLDSMVGYKQGRYKELGFISAKIDDIANFIPSRLTMLLLMLPLFLKKEQWKIVLADRKKHSSPNAGNPEAAFAVLLNIQMGGPAIYHGEVVDKPYINEKGNKATLSDLKKGLTIVYRLYYGSLGVLAVAILSLIIKR